MGILIISVVILIIFRAIFPVKESMYYNGPKPSKKQQNHDQNWIADHLEVFPDSKELSQAFPQAARRARAAVAYRELQRLHESGVIDDIDYQRQLEKILPLIDIREDIY